MNDPNGRVVLFDVGPARDQPVSFRRTAYVRVGASKTELNRHPEKARAIWTQGSDWSAEVCRQATVDDLDPEALLKAREQFAVKHPTQTKDVAAWDDATFLNKARVSKQGAVTNTKEIDQALMPKLPDLLTDGQKRSRISNLLQDLRRSGKIVNQGTRSQPAWTHGPGAEDTP